jgi:pimeloyl-ACP methyl ester carboxylesterase
MALQQKLPATFGTELMAAARLAGNAAWAQPVANWPADADWIDDREDYFKALAEARYRNERGVGDGWIGMAAHPGEGVFMLQVIDPSVADEGDMFSVVPELDMYNRDNGWRPWPEPCQYDKAWLGRYRLAQRDRVARLDAIAKNALADAESSRQSLRGVDKASPAYRELRARAVAMKYMVIYRTLADPAYLDLSIEPDDRPLGSLFAFPDPFDANYGRGGLARTMTTRGWLSTWSGLSSSAKLADTMPKVTVPTLLVHPTADTEIRVSQAMEIVDNAGASDKTYVEMKGAPHYLEGHRTEALAVVADWLAKRFP